MPNKKSTQVYRTDLVSVGIGQGRKEITPYLFSQTDFDPEGRVLLQCTYSASGLIVEKVVFRYDDKGRPVHETYYSDDMDPSEEKSFEYDGTGKVSFEKKHYLDGSFDTVRYHYNEDGQLLSKVTVNDEGEEEQQETLTYLEGRLATREIRDAAGDVIFLEELEYDDKGNVVSHLRKDDSTGEYFRLKVYYNPDGRKEKEELYDEEGELTDTTHFETDQEGRVVRTVEEDGESRKIRQFRFDAAGNNLGYEETDGSGDRKVVVEHTYDADNNPLSSLVFVNGGYRVQSQHYELKYEHQWFD